MELHLFIDLYATECVKKYMSCCTENKYMPLCIYMYTYIYTYIHTYIRIYMYIYMHIYIYVCICICVCVHMHECVYFV